MRIGVLIERYPTLYHMAEVPNWPGIQARGLLSTSALLDLYGYTGGRRELIESRWRPAMVKIEKTGLPPAWIRDQQPMPPAELRPLLEQGMSVEDWYRLINAKVFFWAEWSRLEMLLGAKFYRGFEHVVLKVNTRLLLDQCSARIALTSMNSGSTFRRANGEDPPPRGADTFQAIDRFPESGQVVEVAVDRGVENVLSVAASAEVRVCAGWKQPSSLVRPLWSA